MKILVVDDERAIRNSLKEILADEGYEVEVAEDGAAGIDSLNILPICRVTLFRVVWNSSAI